MKVYRGEQALGWTGTGMNLCWDEIALGWNVWHSFWLLSCQIRPSHFVLPCVWWQLDWHMKHTGMMVKMTRDQKHPRTVLILIDQFVVTTTTILCPFSYPERTVLSSLDSPGIRSPVFDLLVWADWNILFFQRALWLLNHAQYLNTNQAIKSKQWLYLISML